MIKTETQELRQLRLERERTGAANAERLMGDPLLIEAFDTIAKAIIDEWSACEDPARRDRLWVQHHLLDSIKGHFNQVILTGKLAATELGDFDRRRLGSARKANV